MISREQLRAALGVHPNTISKWLASGRLPRPDVQVTRKSAYWRPETLEKAGILILSAPTVSGDLSTIHGDG
ncbi:MAG: helix-turn-helix domain-containing protein [Burkholderiaceae bacterium]|nr:helix-turn-helix domain-containing protein [Burkholderiaceae bacterium]